MARSVTENRDGSFTVVQDGQTYYVPANDSLGRQESLRAEANAGKSSGGNISNASSGGSNSGGSSGGSSSGGGNYTVYDKNTNIANEKAYLNSQLEQARQSGNKGLEDWALRQLNNLNSYESTQAYLNSQSIGSGTYGGGGGGLGGSVVSDNSQLISNYQNQLDSLQQQLQAAQNANDRALQAAIEAAISRLEQQKPEILRNAEKANTAAYNAYTQASNPFGIGAESAAAIGLGNSGYAESSMVNLGNTYQNALNQNEQSKLDMLSDLEEAKRQALLTGDIERANAAAEYAQMMAQQGYQNANSILNARLQMEQLAQQAAQQNWNNQLTQQQWEYEKENDAYNKAWQLASAGVINPQIAATLGMTEEELRRMVYGEQQAVSYNKDNNGKTPKKKKEDEELPIPEQEKYNAIFSPILVGNNESMEPARFGGTYLNTTLQAINNTSLNEQQKQLLKESALQRAYEQNIVSDDEFLRLANMYGITVI